MNVMACPGMIRIKRGVMPFQRARTPSSRAITPQACTRPVYFGVFPAVTTCFCSLVLTTSVYPQSSKRLAVSTLLVRSLRVRFHGNGSERLTQWIICQRSHASAKSSNNQRLRVMQLTATLGIQNFFLNPLIRSEINGLVASLTQHRRD